MRKNSKRQSTPKALARRSLFGPPPILEGENPKHYYELLQRVFGAVRPTDFIEEIWVHDIADVVWTLLRLRRIQAASLTAEVSEKARDEASSLAVIEAKQMTGMDREEQEEMKRLLANTGPDWETRVEQNPRANEKFQELYQSAWPTLDMDAIQAKVMRSNLGMIERIEQLIMIAERRFDAVIREIDRHRLAQQQLSNSVQDALDAEFKIVTPEISEQKTTTQKAA